MYQYDAYDQKIVDERVAQYRDQTRRYLAGELTDDEFRPFRLQNGLYIQRYAPMLRMAVPYGLMSSRQLRMLAHISRRYDRGYAHISTRQNVQLNWPLLEEVPDILADLASVQMHAIQTSGNCIRNTTTDQFAGVVAGEIADPRPTCELIRQWSTFHPEFAFLPRKFKIAVNAHSEVDRAATAVHDIGVYMTVNADGEPGYRILVGGGLGRTPMVGAIIRDFLPQRELIAYLEAILRVYNLYGRRDNKYKARIKILVKALTPAVFAEKVEAEFAHLQHGELIVPAEEFARLAGFFTEPAYEALTDNPAALATPLQDNKAFALWYQHNTFAHKKPGYRIVTLSLKRPGVAPGDITAAQMETVADLADAFSFGELRTTHEQNIVLADVRQDQLLPLWEKLRDAGLATANIGFLTNIICCPGGDFCSLANAKSIPIAEQIQRRFADLDQVYDIGLLDINISGCMNACGHHHVGHIGILGVDKKGEEYYQVTLGGSSDHGAAIGDILGPSFFAEDMGDVIEEILNTYLDNRQGGERFLDTYRRIGIEKFKERVYA
ncbi:sulfite reductase (NADPH) hemoprotein beta-component [Fluviicoccus keumensis]|uniref:Sulfite reductase (NADPH) hemoprotein beta-component n=1 Tax=Fluviicoccus keumensis TaxID=1435465 RepID=A0A4Q7Z3M7_9GAMM|nr:nitrite/sulfite reductase [Fluviicoccus keumensis]RZU44877.1 sulfite reductase (NADPH) hemoprotein beta-component [Fluviicoccus keumensis]